MSTDKPWLRLRRRLAAVVPHRGRHRVDPVRDRAEALRARGAELVEAGSYPEAVDAFQEAVDVYLGSGRWIRYRNEIVWTQYPLAVALGGAGRYDEALSAAAGPLRILRRLNRRPGAPTRPWYAELLRLVAHWQDRTGRTADARATYEEASALAGEAATSRE